MVPNLEDWALRFVLIEAWEEEAGRGGGERSVRGAGEQRRRSRGGGRKTKKKTAKLETVDFRIRRAIALSLSSLSPSLPRSKNLFLNSQSLHLPELVRDLAAHDPLGEPREVLDVRRQHELATGQLGPHRFTFEDEPSLEQDRLELGARGVDRRRVGRGPGADDADGRALGRG